MKSRGPGSLASRRLLDSRQHHEVPMRRIGLVVVLVLSFLVPLGAEGQQTEKVRRIGVPLRGDPE